MIYVVRGLDSEGQETFSFEVSASCRDRAAEIALSRAGEALSRTWRLLVAPAEPPAIVLPDLLGAWGVIPEVPT